MTGFLCFPGKRDGRLLVWIMELRDGSGLRSLNQVQA